MRNPCLVVRIEIMKKKFGTGRSLSKSYFPKSPGLSHLQLAPKMLHRHSQSRQHKLRLGLQVLPRMIQSRPRLQQKRHKTYSLLNSKVSKSHFHCCSKCNITKVGDFDKDKWTQNVH